MVISNIQCISLCRCWTLYGHTLLPNRPDGIPHRKSTRFSQWRDSNLLANEWVENKAITIIRLQLEQNGWTQGVCRSFYGRRLIESLVSPLLGRSFSGSTLAPILVRGDGLATWLRLWRLHWRFHIYILVLFSTEDHITLFFLFREIKMNYTLGCFSKPVMLSTSLHGGWHEDQVQS